MNAHWRIEAPIDIQYEVVRNSVALVDRFPKGTLHMSLGSGTQLLVVTCGESAVVLRFSHEMSLNERDKRNVGDGHDLYPFD